METVTKSTATIGTSQLQDSTRTICRTSPHYQTRSRSHNSLATNCNTSVNNINTNQSSPEPIITNPSDESNHSESGDEENRKISYQSEQSACSSDKAASSITDIACDVSSPAASNSSNSYFTQKNKRKNFNPRFSANDEQTIPDSFKNSTIDNSVSDNNSIISNKDVIMENAIKLGQSDNSDLTATDHNAIASEAMSINWRKVLTDNIIGMQQTSAAGQDSEALDQKSIQTAIDKTNFFNIPNTNFSIGKANTLSIEDTQSTTTSAATTLSGKLNESLSNLHNSALETATAQLEQARSILHHHQQQVRQQQQQQDSQTKLEFACNAFNAVQELLNVYGLSISPNDIVDAFKKQAAAAVVATISTAASTATSTTTSMGKFPILIVYKKHYKLF